MALVEKNDIKQIFADQAPSIDKPASFANYPRGWDTSRPNNGKPTIKQFNYLQQRTDQNFLWIHQNGAALPYDATMEYAEGAPVVKEGKLQQKQGDSWVSVGVSTAAELMDASGKSQQEVNNELYVYRKPVIYASKLKTDGTDQISELNALAAEAASKRLELVLPRGTITINDEFIPPNNLKISSICAVSSNSNGGSGTVLRWGGASGVGKAILRCSTAAIGVTPTDAMVGVEIDGIEIVATGCDYGAYFRYFTNESRVKNLLVRNAKKCNIWGGQLWFSWFDQITSIAARDKGIVFGVALSGETGDLAVNGINFPYIRAHTSGRDGTYNKDTNERGGCGVLLNTQGCNYGLIQSELNGGIGVIEASVSRTNHINALYLESNCQTSSDTLKTSFLMANGNAIRSLTLRSVTLAKNQVLVNNNTSSPIYLEQVGVIDQTYQCLNGVTGSAGFTIIGEERPLLAGMGGSEQARLIKYSITEIIKKENVNLRYTSELGTLSFRLYQYRSVNMFIVPKATLTGTFTMSFNLAGTSFSETITNPIEGVPVRVRQLRIEKGAYTLTQTTTTTENFNVDIFLLCGTFANGRNATYINM